MPLIFPRRALPAMIALALAAPVIAADKPKVPEGFEVRLVATVPAVQYPCQVTTAPGGLLFVAEDPMDQVGPYESKNGRILLFRDGQDPVVFADGFRAVQGMAWRDGVLFVSHMPYLTVVKDDDGDGKSDAKTDLFTDLGPTKNQGLNDHIVSGLQFGIDGWLYISVGDKGIPRATGKDGRTVQIKGGGSVRCRPDGTGIEVVSTGTRNHLEVNLDENDNIFTYDNTDDGLGWWTRVTHHIDGGYYGYAYDYHTRPDRFLNRMAEYGGGSPCGAVFYKEDAWPEKYRGMGFWAEWGKGKVQAIRFKPRGASFEVAEMIDFATGDGVENFRPIDLAISHDGKTMYVADWGMGGWGSKTEKVGRVWAISPKEEVNTRPRGSDSDPIADQIKQLDHPSFNERLRAQAALIRGGKAVLPEIALALAGAQGYDGRRPLSQEEERDLMRKRMHLIWVVDGIAGGTPEGRDALLLAALYPNPDAQVQAIRALGLRRDRGAARALTNMLRATSPNNPDAVDPKSPPPVRLEALIALGRIGDALAISAIIPEIADADPYVAFAARVALRRIGDWKGAADAGLKSGDPKVRLGVLSAMDEQYDLGAVGTLVEYEMGPDHPTAERAKALQYLASVHREPKPWDGSWWGTRPAAGEPPAKVVEWEATPTITEVVHLALADREAPIRIAAIAAVRDMKDQAALPILRERFAKEPEDAARKQVALALGEFKDKLSLPSLTAALRDPNAPDAIREAALSAVEAIGTDSGAAALADLLEAGDLPADRQARVLQALGKFKVKSSLPEVLAKLTSQEAPVRAAAAEAASQFEAAEGVVETIRPLLNDTDLAARRASYAALAKLGDRPSIPALIAAAESDETRFEATEALSAMPDLRALQVYLRGLTDKNADVRKACGAALASIRDQAAPVLEQLSARHELAPSAIPELAKVYAAVKPIPSWQVLGPLPIDDPAPFPVDGAIDLKGSVHAPDGKYLTWWKRSAIDAKGQVDLNRAFPNSADNLAAFAYAEVDSPTARKAQVVAGSDDTLTIWINGAKVYDFSDRRGYDPEADRLDVDLASGTNRILIKCGNRGGPWQFSLGMSSPTQYAFLQGPAAGAFDPEAFRQFALKSPGSADKGKALFADAKGLNCVKCHAVKGQGGGVGPDLSDIGARYPKDDIIRSILYPSAKIFSGYEPVTIATNDGRVVTGIVKGETADAITLQDAEAKTTTVAKADVEEKKVSDVSIMPNGLAEGLTSQDFADLVAFLETLKDKPLAKP